MTFRLATPDEQARMSWHARAKYAQRLAAHHRTQANEAQAVADVMDHRSPVVSAAFARLIAELNTALEEDARRKQAKRRAAARAAGRTTVLTDAGRAAVRANLDRAKGVWWERRATLRAEAHQMFASGRRSYVVAQRLDVPLGTVQRWRTDWRRASENTTTDRKENAA